LLADIGSILSASSNGSVDEPEQSQPTTMRQSPCVPESSKKNYSRASKARRPVLDGVVEGEGTHSIRDQGLSFLLLVRQLVRRRVGLETPGVVRNVDDQRRLDQFRYESKGNNQTRSVPDELDAGMWKKDEDKTNIRS
jgi:hypothetical protein